MIRKSVPSGYHTMGGNRFSDKIMRKLGMKEYF
jgi:hypothetical protein